MISDEESTRGETGGGILLVSSDRAWQRVVAAAVAGLGTLTTAETLEEGLNIVHAGLLAREEHPLVIIDSREEPTPADHHGVALIASRHHRRIGATAGQEKPRETEYDETSHRPKSRFHAAPSRSGCESSIGDECGAPSATGPPTAHPRFTTTQPRMRRQHRRRAKSARRRRAARPARLERATFRPAKPADQPGASLRRHHATPRTL